MKNQIKKIKTEDINALKHQYIIVLEVNDSQLNANYI